MPDPSSFRGGLWKVFKAVDYVVQAELDGGEYPAVNFFVFKGKIWQEPRGYIWQVVL